MKWHLINSKSQKMLRSTNKSGERKCLQNYLSLRSRLHGCFYHLVRTSTNGLYTISGRRTVWAIRMPTTFTINLPFELLHPLWKSCQLIIGSFSWLLGVGQNLQNDKWSSIFNSSQFWRQEKAKQAELFVTMKRACRQHMENRQSQNSAEVQYRKKKYHTYALRN